MNVKKNILVAVTALFFITAFYNCSDWTEVEPETVVEYGNTETSRPASYYEALRRYKESDHSIAFGWFSGWSGPAASTAGMLAGIPDSLDLVSIWGQWYDLSPEKIEDMRYVQEVKGTKVVFASFTLNVGHSLTPSHISEQGQPAVEEYWGWVEDKTEDDEATKAANKIARETAIRKYAGAFVDSVYKYGYDGFDMDHEPHYGGSGKLASYPDRIHIFLSEIRKQFDERGGNKLLVVDGEPQALLPESGPLVDWMIVQAYTVSGGTPSPTATGTETDKDSRLNTCIRNFDGVMTPQEVTNRYVITENMESAIDALNGGYLWRTRDGVLQDKNVCPSLLGMARWEPLNGFRKGGFGGYRFDAEAVNKPSYKWMRRGIQAQNPAVN